MPTKVDNLEEMNKFLETYNFPTVNKEEIENLKGLTTSNKIESVIQKLPINTGLVQTASWVNLTFKEQ